MEYGSINITSTGKPGFYDVESLYYNVNIKAFSHEDWLLTRATKSEVLRFLTEYALD